MTTPDALREAVRAALEQNIGVGTVDARTRDAIIANVLGAFDRSALALTTTPLAGEVGWLPIGSAELWGLYVVTDGKWAAVSQLAEADDGSRYWAVDPEDGLDWEPTHCMPLPGAAPTPSNIGDAEARAVREAIVLIDELNERKKSRDFWGIGQTLHAKLCTIRMTLAAAKLSGAGDFGMPIETAPKDGTEIELLPTLSWHVGKWNPAGNSWVDGDLVVTGVWDSGDGWFEPCDVYRWRALTNPPKATCTPPVGEGK